MMVELERDQGFIKAAKGKSRKGAGLLFIFFPFVAFAKSLAPDKAIAEIKGHNTK